MSIKQFIQEENVKMLWEVICDEPTFNNLPTNIQREMYALFINNIQGFFENERMKPNSLVDMNKKYILVILTHIKKNYLSNKIKIHNEPPIKELITYEEIQNDRKTQFERDLNRRQEEFEEFRTIKAPPVPEFSDKGKDQPIKDMEKILKEMQSQRNYEIETINNYNSTAQVDNWLTPQETSVKNDKFEASKDPIIDKEYPRFKYLNNLTQTNNQGTQEVIDKKRVSFNPNEEIQTFDINEEEDDIFFKLKQIKENRQNNQYINNNQDNQYNDTNNNEILQEKRITNLERNVENINTKLDKIMKMLLNYNNNNLFSTT